MRILMLLNSYERDGPGNLVHALISTMRFEANVEVYTAALARSGDFKTVYDELNIPTMEFDMTSWFDWKVVNRLKDRIRECDFDVIHTHLIRPDLIGRVAARFCKTPCVVSTEHGVHAWSEKGRALEPFVKTLYRQTTDHCVDRIAAVSDAVKNDLLQRGVDPTKITTIHNGIDLNVFVPIPPERRRDLRALMCPDCDERMFVAFVGNFIKRKGALHFIDALPSVLKRNPNVFPLLIGEGPEEQTLRERVKEHGLKGRVAFIGKLAAQLPNLLASLDAVVVPSQEEPFGLIAAEAMACRTPVAAFNVGGLSDIVADGETGFLAPSGDTDALANSICRIVEDEARRVEMGLKARERVKKLFNIEITTKKYLDLYRDVLIRKGRIAPEAPSI